MVPNSAAPHNAPEIPTSQEDWDARGLKMAKVQATLGEHFPDLWRAVEAGLAACATLCLEDNVNPTALIYVGAASAGKTTAAYMFEGHPMTYRTDDVTGASLVSHASQRSKEQLKKIDLLPTITDKVMLTPEMASFFRGKQEELEGKYRKWQVALDGQGIQTNSGTHGSRGYKGLHLFVWLGCTTPLSPYVWRVMSTLGSRLFFFDLSKGRSRTENDVIQSRKDSAYSQKRDMCRVVVHEYLTEIFQNGVRSVPWDPSADDDLTMRGIYRLAQLLSIGRANADDPSSIEEPERAFTVLTNLARGRAIIYGRRAITQEDLPFVAEVVLSSMQARRGRLIRALARAGGEMTAPEVQAKLGVGSRHTALEDMQDLGKIGLAEYIPAPPIQTKDGRRTRTNMLEPTIQNHYSRHGKVSTLPPICQPIPSQHRSIPGPFDPI